MNPYSGHLIELKDAERAPKDYEPLPPELLSEAREALAGKQETHVNLRASTPLAKWAKKKRLEKIAAKSRRRNRNGQR